MGFGPVQWRLWVRRPFKLALLQTPYLFHSDDEMSTLVEMKTGCHVSFVVCVLVKALGSTLRNVKTVIVGC